MFGCTNSASLSSKHAVPQGSVLVPYLFTRYTQLLFNDYQKAWCRRRRTAYDKDVIIVMTMIMMMNTVI